MAASRYADKRHIGYELKRAMITRQKKAMQPLHLISLQQLQMRQRSLPTGSHNCAALSRLLRLLIIPAPVAIAESENSAW